MVLDGHEGRPETTVRSSGERSREKDPALARLIGFRSLFLWCLDVYGVRRRVRTVQHYLELNGSWSRYLDPLKGKN